MASGGFRSDQHMDLSWLRFRPQASRLVARKHDVLVQHVRVNASADSWLRVVDNRELIFEGNPSRRSDKDWSGPGPFTSSGKSQRGLHLLE